MKERMDAWIKSHQNKAFGFLRDLIALPSTSCNESEVVKRIVAEMEELHFDEVRVDAMGNVHGRIGSGPRVIAFDGHIDTVDVGRIENWQMDPYVGHEDDTYIYGRGASDQTGGFVSAVYSGAMLKALELTEGLTLWVVGTVQEEDCDGLCWQYILREGLLRPEIVVLTEPTSLGVYRGHRGRMEIQIEVLGKSAHGSAPERGENAIYKMARIIQDLEALNDRLRSDDFLGKGTLAVSEIFSTAPSRCAVADGCCISVDRRLTDGETVESALAEIRALDSVIEAKGRVSLYRYNRPSYTGHMEDVPCAFPTWVIPESHKMVRLMAEAHAKVHGTVPLVDKWTFSTNGVAIMGMEGIPCVGYGPGDEVEAHAPNEKIKKQDITHAIATYGFFAATLKEV